MKPQSLRSSLACLPLLVCVVLAGCRPKPTAPAEQVPTSPAPRAESAPQKDAPAQQPAPQARPSGPIRFADATAAAGIRFRHNSGAFGKKYLPETMGSGVCAIDYDGDGWQDIFFVNSNHWPGQPDAASYSALYRNNHDGTFTDVTKQAGLAVAMYGMGCAVGDFDNDGHDDLYVTAVDGNHLFRNTGKARFVDVTAKSGLRDPGFATGAVWFDYDNDGKLDLFVSHYVEWSIAKDQSCSLDGKSKSYCTPELYKGESASLFHNLGNGRFEDVTRKAGVYDPTAKSLGVALLDYDDDGWIDLFVANDTQPNKLYRNNHNGTFTESAFATGVAYSDAGKARAGMGADVADYDLSGQQSLLIGNFSNESLSLYHNEGGGLFTDKAMASGVASASAKYLTFGTFFFDYDLDGLPDIFAANGHVADDIHNVQAAVQYAEPPLLFRNRGHGKFDVTSNSVGPALRQEMVARGAAYLDYDNDGDLDIVLSTNNGPARLLRNDNGNQNDMLRVQLIGVHANRDGIGAKVSVIAAKGQRLSRMVHSGSSYLSQSELPLTFGLGKPGDHASVALEIQWPGGKKESIRNVSPNQFVTIQEGKGITNAQPIVFRSESSQR